MSQNVTKYSVQRFFGSLGQIIMKKNYKFGLVSYQISSVQSESLYCVYYTLTASILCISSNFGNQNLEMTNEN